MAFPSLQSVVLLAAAIALSSTTSATNINTQLVGTWSTKSGKVLTGPGFFDPVNDSLIEPSHTGISYSFTADGYYEEAYYRTISNPTDPACPQAVMQWQHGTFEEMDNTSLILTPFAVDGRQLHSDPCTSDKSSYTRYHQTETMKTYQVYTDSYYNILRLDLYEWDGTPMNPMYLAYDPPLMLPTITMNPTKGGSSQATSKSTAAASSTANSKREYSSDEEYDLPLNKHARRINRETEKPQYLAHSNTVWWMGLGMSFLGGVAYLL